ncbi:hypothetical protein ACHAXA_007999 [Cyclostephanos tholiformis]|uniref:Uncharacterized protein n=1 Tax=Cyclostephanos tholiformis TaxID=382380 RepID=A0ABD3R6R5_9STRA
MQHPTQHWTQSAPPPGSAGGLPGPPHHPQYGHLGGIPPPPPPPQGWGHPQAPPPPHPSHQGGGSQLPIIGAPPPGIFRERSGSGKPTDGSVGVGTNGYNPPQGFEGHPPSHGYSHGPPQGYSYPPHSSHNGQQPPLGYYGSQHPPLHHVNPSQQGPPPPNHNQWGHLPTYGGAPPPGPSSHPGSSHNSHISNGNSALWEHQQHTSQSRQQENPHHSEGYFSSHPPPSSGFSRHGLPQQGGAPPPTHTNGGRASYNPSRGGPPPPPPQSQPPHGSQTGEASNICKGPPPSASSTPGMPPTQHGSSIPPPPHHPHGLPPPMTSQPPPPPLGYPSNHYHGPPPTRNSQNPSIHTSYSTASTRTSISVTTSVAGPSSTPTLHNASFLSHNTPGTLATSTTYTDDEKGRGSYKCGRCGVPKKGHVCPYQPKVKRRPEDLMPEMKCVSTQVEMDEFMTLRRLNIEIQGYPESYAAEPLDMVGTEVGQYPPPQPPLSHAGTPGYPGQPLNSPHGDIIGSSYPTHLMPFVTLSGDPGVGEPLASGPPPAPPPPQHGVSPPCSREGLLPLAMSSSHEAGPQTSLPSLSSIPHQPTCLPSPLHEASSLSSSQILSPGIESSPEILVAQTVELPFPNDTTSLEVCEGPVLSGSRTTLTKTEYVSATASHSGEAKLESKLSTIDREALESAAITTGGTDDELHLMKGAERTDDSGTGEFYRITGNGPSSEEAYDELYLIKGKDSSTICEVKSSLSPSEKLVTNPSYFENGSAVATDELHNSVNEVESSNQRVELSKKKRRV